jgi:hypothetical protein
VNCLGGGAAEWKCVDAGDDLIINPFATFGFIAQDKGLKYDRALCWSDTRNEPFKSLRD